MLTLAVAVVLATLSVALATWILMDRLASSESIATSIPGRIAVRGGTNVWTLGGADATGVWWRLAQQTADLRVAQADLEVTAGEFDDGTRQGWCLLAPHPARTASIAVGWPAPWILWRFAAHSSTEAFPPSPEIADEIEGITRGVERALKGEGRIAFTARVAAMALTVITLASCGWWWLVRRLLRHRLSNAKHRDDQVHKEIHRRAE